MKTIDNFNFKGKTVLLRTDINSDVKNGRVILGPRIKEAAITIKELKKKGAKVVVVAHQGRKGKKDFLSLKSHAKLLNKYVGIKFVSDIVGKGAEKEIFKLKNGEAILLENVRFLDSEMDTKNKEIVDFFKGKIDIYVNDAFSVCHRAQTTISELPKYFPSCMGRILEREVRALEKVNLKNCLYILGGGKPADNIKLLGKGNKVLACGFFGQMFMVSREFKFGEHENFLKDFLKDEFSVKAKLKKKFNKNIILPSDFAVKVGGKRKELDLSDFPNEHVIYDLGKKTIEEFKKEIRKAKAVYIKGPAGDCSEKEFSVGTFEILKSVANSSAFSVIGGGHLNDAIEKSKISKKKFNHISLSGGALLSYLAGEKLPGLVELEKSAKRIR